MTIARARAAGRLKRSRQQREQAVTPVTHAMSILDFELNPNQVGCEGSLTWCDLLDMTVLTTTTLVATIPAAALTTKFDLGNICTAARCTRSWATRSDSNLIRMMGKTGASMSFSSRPRKRTRPYMCSRRSHPSF